MEQSQTTRPIAAAEPSLIAHDPLAQPETLNFSDRFEWAGSFVKRASRGGLPVTFRLSSQLVINHLPAIPGASPIQVLEQSADLVHAACSRALDRVGPRVRQVDLLPQDFQAQAET
jgi:hypothetical protein